MHLEANSDLILVACDSDYRSPDEDARDRNMWSEERLTGAQAEYEIRRGDQEVLVSLGVYELGVATTPPEHAWQSDLDDEELIQRSRDCYGLTSAENWRGPLTLEAGIQHREESSAYDTLFLPIPGVDVESAAYRINPDGLARALESSAPDTPILDLPLDHAEDETLGYGRPDIKAAAYWVVDSHFLVALSIQTDGKGSETLGELIDSIHFPEAIDLVTNQVRANWWWAIYLPKEPQLEMYGVRSG
jgi:hypothetical protein